jgi:oxygen-independent coproporphyrinogen-3 oxidase
MAGIYLHIPFCKKACHYCDFHFSTSLQQELPVIHAMERELALRKSFLNETVDTIYFGGGTPSLLLPERISFLLDAIYNHFPISEQPEITLEANPDDVSPARASAWKKAGINRISLGIQSFQSHWLEWMNRAHNAEQSLQAITELQAAGFENISIDLIYGMPEQADVAWLEEIQMAIDLQVTHLSCYALTVEPRTALWHMIETGKAVTVDPDQQARMFLLLMDSLEKAGYEHYEISNFAKPGKRSRHNSAYWKGKTYLGIGPAAHSFNGSRRMWNIQNNTSYTSQIEAGVLPLTEETLTAIEQWNEYIMTSIRTMEGISLKRIAEQFGVEQSEQLLLHAATWLKRNLLQQTDEHLCLTREGKLLADQIASDLFQLAK